MGATLMDIVLRASIMFVVLYLLLRLLGKRELSQMTPFDFVVLVVMGDLIQQGVTQTDFSVTGATLAIVTFATWCLLLSWVAYIFPWVEDMLDGEGLEERREGKECDGTGWMRG